MVIRILNKIKNWLLSDFSLNKTATATINSKQVYLDLSSFNNFVISSPGKYYLTGNPSSYYIDINIRNKSNKDISIEGAGLVINGDSKPFIIPAKTNKAFSFIKSTLNLVVLK